MKKIELLWGRWLASASVILGVGAALARLMTDLIYGVKTRDPIVFVSVAVLLSAVSWFATYIPARRASRVDPIVALRHE